MTWHMSAPLLPLCCSTCMLGSTHVCCRSSGALCWHHCPWPEASLDLLSLEKQVPVLEGGSVVSQDYSRDVPSPKEALEGGWGKRLRESSFLQSHVCSQAAAPQDIQQVSNLKEEKPALFCCPSGCVISLERLIS